MDLFEYINVSFTEKNKQISNYEKAKHFFMYNRFLSIKYPHVANFLNRTEIPSAYAVDSIINFLKTAKHHSTPKFFYTKAVSKEKDNTWYPKDKEQLKMYLNMNGYSMRLFEDSLKMDPEGTRIDYTEFIEEIS